MSSAPPRAPSAAGPCRAAQRGFTLLELMISAAISVIILAAIAVAFMAANGAYTREDSITRAVEANRVAANYLQRVLTMAGYGLPPETAFDFDASRLPGATKDNYQIAGPPSFTTDDLAFRYRDPEFLARGSLNGSNLTFDASAQGPNFKVSLPAGQPLLLICNADAESYYVARLGADATLTSGASSVNLVAYGAASPFPAAPPSCLTNPAPNDAFVMLLYDVRLRVVQLGTVPYLVAFHNFNAPDPATNPDFDPLVANVEDFQVAYVMNRPLSTSTCCGGTLPYDSNRNWILGDDTASVPELPNPALPGPPTYDTPYDDPSRFDAHPSNIRAVRVSLVTRSELHKAGAPSRPLVVENHVPASSTPDRYYRASFTATIPVPNMASRTAFAPPIGLASGLNAWGG